MILFILTPIFSFFYDILHCATQQQQQKNKNKTKNCSLHNAGKHHTVVRNSNYKPLVLFYLYNSIHCNSLFNQEIVECALRYSFRQIYER